MQPFATPVKPSFAASDNRLEDMPSQPNLMPLAPPDLPPRPCLLELATFSYDERRVLMPAISEALTLCGCWLLDRKPLSLTQMEFRFELELRSIVDLYAALIAAGLELTRGSHLDLTSLCMVRKHKAPPGGLASIITVRLEVSFLEDVTLPAIMSTGTAFA